MRWIVPALLMFALAGCSGFEGSAKVTEDDVTPAKVAAAWPTDVKIHRNDKAEVECPIMKAPIAKPEQSVGFQDVNGKRYYFCCDMCPEKFKANPALYTQ